MNIQKTIIAIMLLCSVVARAQTNDFIGSYYYTKMEYAEQLHILPSQRFSWQQVYGAVDKDLRGKWTLTGDTLQLVFDPLPGEVQPGKFEAILTDSGNLNFITFDGRPVTKERSLQALEKKLSPEIAQKLAQPIDYSEAIAAQKEQVQKQKTADQKRFEKFNSERKKYGKYHGFFKSEHKNFPFRLAFNAKHHQFIATRPDSLRHQVATYFVGDFEVKNDTAYATTNPDQDEIKVFAYNAETSSEKIQVYLKNLEPKHIQLQTGKTFASSNFVTAEAFQKENDSVQHLRLEKSDSLWVAVGEKERHIYSFPLAEGNHSILIKPTSYPVETWVEQPIFINSKDEIHTLFNGKTILKLSTGEGFYPPLKMMSTPPNFNGKRYFPVERARLFKMKE